MSDVTNQPDEQSDERSPSVVEAELPAEEFALAETFRTVPGVSFRCVEVVENGDRAVVPLVWAYGAPRDALDSALADDPSVEEASVVGTFDDAVLYEMEWGDRIDLVFQVLADSHATLLNGASEDGTWTFRLLYPDRKALSRTHEFCDDRGIPLDIRSIREMDGTHAGRFGLTTDQYEALRTARERGYFEVPRGIELHDLADELDISHQALSERLRRARGTLVEEALLTESPST